MSMRFRPLVSKMVLGSLPLEENARRGDMDTSHESVCWGEAGTPAGAFVGHQGPGLQGPEIDAVSSSFFDWFIQSLQCVSVHLPLGRKLQPAFALFFFGQLGSTCTQHSAVFPCLPIVDNCSLVRTRI